MSAIETTQPTTAANPSQGEVAAETTQKSTLLSEGAEHESTAGAKPESADAGTGGEAEKVTKTDTAEQPPQEKEGSKPEASAEPYTFQAQEGREYDAETIAAYGAAAQKLGITQEQAQQLLDAVAPVMEARGQQGLTDAFRQFVSDEDTKRRGAWAEEVRNDEVLFGTDGAKWKEAQEAILQSFEHAGTPELLKVLDETGVGSNRAFLRYAHAASKALAAMREDTLVTGNDGPPQVQKSAAQVLFPKSLAAG